MKIKSIFRSEISPKTGWIIMGLLLLITVFHYSLYYYQNGVLDNRLKVATQTYQLSKWKDIEGVINLSTLAAKDNAKNVADNIVHRIEAEYPDSNELRDEFDSGNYNSPKFTKIILESISGKYLFGIKSRSNDIFVINKKGVLADMNVEKFSQIQRGFDEEMNTHFNPKLGFAALENIILQKNDNLVFYEPNYPTSNGHRVVTYPSMEDLRQVFYNENLNGLKNYTFLVPVYITDNGDLFGNPDIDNDGHVNMTHKIIVVQRFNVYDIIQHSFDAQITTREQMYFNTVSQIKETKNFYTFAFVAMLLLDIIVLLFFLVYTTGGMTEEFKENERDSK